MDTGEPEVANVPNPLAKAISGIRVKYDYRVRVDPGANIWPQTRKIGGCFPHEFHTVVDRSAPLGLLAANVTRTVTSRVDSCHGH